MADPYADALDELDALHKAGKLTAGQYEAHRAKLLAEAAGSTKPSPARITIAVVCTLILIGLVVSILLAIFNAL